MLYRKEDQRGKEKQQERLCCMQSLRGQLCEMVAKIDEVMIIN